MNVVPVTIGALAPTNETLASLTWREPARPEAWSAPSMMCQRPWMRPVPRLPPKVMKRVLPVWVTVTEAPKPPIVAITPNLSTGRKLSAVWGVHCVVAEDAHDLDDMVSRAGSIAFRDGFARAGQRVIIVAGVPLGSPGTTNMLRIASVGPDGDADI